MTKLSQQSNKILEQALAENDGELSWEEAVARIKEGCNVQRNTAETYIRRSDKADIDTTLTGEKVVVDPSQSGETILHDEEGVLKMEVGERTSTKFGNLPVLQDVGHPLVPTEHKNGYYRRKVIGRKSDVQVVTATMADPDFSTLLEGEAGVGKDKLVMHICANTNRPILRITASSNEDLIEVLIGHYSASEDGFEFRKGLAAIAVEYGYVLVIDEFNMLEGKTQARLNGLLESADSSSLTIPETNEVIEPHPEFMFIGTQNPQKVGYGGTESLNQATQSRFFTVEIPPLDASSEKFVVSDATGWDPNDDDLNVLLGANGGVIPGIRALYKSGKISTWVSTRDAIKIGRMAESLGDAQTAAELVLVGSASPEDKEPIRSAINDQRWK